MDARNEVMSNPFRYHKAATFIEEDVAAAIQAAVHKEGHRSVKPVPHAQFDSYQENRKTHEDSVLKYVCNSFYSDANTIRRALKLTDHQTRAALFRLKAIGKIAEFAVHPNHARKYCGINDAEMVQQAFSKAKRL